MKLTKLLKEYKSIAKEMQRLANRYRILDYRVRYTIHTDAIWNEYNDTRKKMCELNEDAYHIMFEYRTLSESPLYKVMFALGIMPKQHGFRYTDETHTWFKSTQLINIA